MDRGREGHSLIARPNGRPMSELLVKQDGRKPLFSSTNSRGDENKPPASDRSQVKATNFRHSIGSDGFQRSVLSESRNSLGPPRRDSPARSVSPGGTRIPKPTGSSGFSNRKVISLAEAYRMAGEEEDDTGPVDASPSPAPRLWRERRESEAKNMRTFLGRDHLDTKGDPAPRPFSRQSMSALVRPESRASPEKSDEYRRRLYGKARAGLGAEERPQSPSRIPARSPNRDPNRKISSELAPPQIGDSKIPVGPQWIRKYGSKESLNGNGTGGLPALVPGIEDFPLPSVEGGQQQQQQQQEPTPPASRQTSANAVNPSPEKSYAWDIDQDFTAGDLQISDSPRIRVDSRPFANRIRFDEDSEIDINSRTRVATPGSRNTKLDEIRSREVKAGNDVPFEHPPSSRQPNTKLDDILAREAEVESQIPIPDRNQPRPRNTKLDDIRQREINGVPRRALASSRLEEIREQNAMQRSRSPDEMRPRDSRELTRTEAPAYEAETRVPRPQSAFGYEVETKIPPRPQSAFGTLGERVPDTPVTIFKSGDESKIKTVPVEKEAEAPARRASLDHGRSAINSRADSRDLLRRLARAASNSPAPETEAETEAPKLPANPPPAEKPTTGILPSRPGTSRRSLDNDGKTARRETQDSQTASSKPAVEFAGLHRRERSGNSIKSKRSSMQSEPDPTDRIEAEMKLFAPGENQSERGSVRAPSPEPEDEEEEEDDDIKEEENHHGAMEVTPRAPKPDPLTMPTPRVTGAYVDTPATVKVERRDSKGAKEIKEEKKLPERDETGFSARVRGKKTEIASRSRDTDTASDPGTDDQAPTMTTSTGVRRRRARSLPRRRAPLKNTAKPPSVKDDLMQLQRTHNIDDSTLDDLEEVLLGRKTASPKMQALIKDLPNQPSPDDRDFDLTLDNFELDARKNTQKNLTNASDPEYSDGELARYDRMSKSLRTGLLGIRSVKQGIERLENQVSHAETMADAIAPADKAVDNNKAKTPCAESCTAHTNPVTASYTQLLPLPRLYKRTPSFRLTLLGFLMFFASLWYAAETAMCAKYCRPTSCSSPPCIWSYDDPTFGVALPVQLDQWITGGHGRVIFANMREDVEDWTADMMDLALGREMTDVDVDALSFEQKRQHRRRLRKKGLVQSPSDPPEQRTKWDAWHRARVAKDKAKEAREMGYDLDDEEETVGGDERLW